MLTDKLTSEGKQKKYRGRLRGYSELTAEMALDREYIRDEDGEDVLGTKDGGRQGFKYLQPAILRS